MSNFSALKTAIQNAIKQNGNEEITGNLLQGILLSIVETLGDSAINTLETNLSNEATTRGNADTQLNNLITGVKNNVDNGYVYAGIATPSTTPVSGKVFYIALQAGTYTNFGGTTVTEGITILKYNGTSWVKEQVLFTDGGVFDISAYHATGGSLAKYADLTAALGTSGANIPVAIRKGGMSVKYVQSSDNKYIRYNLLADSFTTDITQWAIDDAGVYIDNPEFVEVKLDAEGKILWAIKTDGSIYYGAGVPQQVIDYIEEKIAELSLDEYEDIVAFLNGLEEGDKTLQTLLNEKVDKEEGKSLIDEDVAEGESYTENPEYIDAKTDNAGRLLEGTRTDGTKVFGAGVEIHGKQNINGVEYFVISNPEWLVAWIDASDKILMGIKIDGSNYCGNINLSYYLSQVKELIDTKGANNVDWNALSRLSEAESPEYLNIETDSEGKILAGRTPDGAAFEKIGFAAPKVSVGGNKIENYEDLEERKEITTDNEGRVISYRGKDGTLHENAGIVTPFVNTDSINLSDKGISDIKDKIGVIHYKRPNIPLYGTSNIKSEIFYLPIGDWSSYDNDVVLIQMYDDTDVNAAKRLTLSSFYIKSTLTPLAGGGYDKTSVNANSVALELHAGKDVVAVNDKYFAKTLWIPQMNGDAILDYTKVSATKVIDPNTGDVIGYEYNGQSTEVKQVTDVPPYKAWKVTKQIEHYCIVDFDFGDFYKKNNVAIGVKYQGSSTTAYRKRNFRFTFYKNNTFAKKNKMKFGDMLRISGFNLKANWTDNSRIKEMIIYPTLLAIWQARPNYNKFPWYNEFDESTAATGFIQGFPIRLYIAGAFYGMMVFGLKKDEKNYVLDGDDDSSGIFVSGSAVSSDCWSNPVVSSWEDEMMDEMSQETTDALTNWLEFINNRLVEDDVAVPFGIKNIPSRMDVQGFIDYFIGLQVFLMWDNTCRNMILHTRSDKKKFYPFFYDLDNSLSSTYPYDDDIFRISAHIPDGQGGENARDMSFWETIVDTFWDEIVCRYRYLRTNVLNIDYIKEIYHAYADSIPSEDYTMENAKWGVSTSKSNFDSVLLKLQDRLFWLDDNYFKY